jgi:hypothetical protein
LKIFKVETKFLIFFTHILARKIVDFSRFYCSNGANFKINIMRNEKELFQALICSIFGSKNTNAILYFFVNRFSQGFSIKLIGTNSLYAHPIIKNKKPIGARISFITLCFRAILDLAGILPFKHLYYLCVYVTVRKNLFFIKKY